jgi:hypothetical protein
MGLLDEFEVSVGAIRCDKWVLQQFVVVYCSGYVLRFGRCLVCTFWYANADTLIIDYSLV